MTNIAITVQDQVLTATPDKLLVSRSVGEVTFTAEFDTSWDGYEITIIFATPHIQKSVRYTGGTMVMPWEVLDRPTDNLRISAVGIKAGHRRPTAHMRHGLAVIIGGAIEGGPPHEYSPALWEQVMAQLQAATLSEDDVLAALAEAGMLTPVVGPGGAVLAAGDKILTVGGQCNG